MALRVESYNNGSNKSNGVSRVRNTPSFTGYKEEIMQDLYHAKAIRRMESMKWLKGEIGGILITALGTGLVAPIFIGFNPFTKPPKDATEKQKEDFDNTKKYTAMRQPISAVLAILFQASIQKYIDKGLDKVFNNPEIVKYASFNVDQQNLNTETKIKDIVRKQMKAEKRTKPSYIRALFSQEAKHNRAKFDIEFNDRVKAMQNEQLQKVADVFRSTGQIKAGDRHLKNKTVAELMNNQIDEYIGNARALQKRADTQISYYVGRAELLMNNEAQLNNIFKPYIDAGQITEEELKTLIAKNKDNTQVKKLLEEILAKPDDLRISRMKRTIDRISKIKDMCGGNYSSESYRRALVERNGYLEEIISRLAETKIKDPNAADEKMIQKQIEEIAKICQFSEDDVISRSLLNGTETFGTNVEKLTKKIYKDITKRYKKLVENSYKSWNQFTKIGIGVFITLPITCTALNWVYPRFMELFFPKLAGVKKQSMQDKNGGNK